MELINIFETSCIYLDKVGHKIFITVCGRLVDRQRTTVMSINMHKNDKNTYTIKKINKK